MFTDFFYTLFSVSRVEINKKESNMKAARIISLVMVVTVIAGYFLNCQAEDTAAPPEPKSDSKPQPSVVTPTVSEPAVKIAVVRGSDFFGPWEPINGQMIFKAAFGDSGTTV
jgi:hypothetical protein